jgi:hypothetical protein
MAKEYKDSSIFFVCHQGLGDHLICSSIYREYAQVHERVVVPVVTKYFSTIKQMLEDLPNIRLLTLYPNYVYRQQRLLLNFAKFLNFEVVRLGRFDAKYNALDYLKLDETFYHQAEIPLEKRWSNFNYTRVESKESYLLQHFRGKSLEPYIFLHEDKARGFVIDKSLIKSNFEIVQPDPDLRYTIFDYRSLIEGASEVHCIESSFSILIDQLAVTDQQLFAHRYARPEAKSSYRHEVGYRRNWQILH